MERKLPVILDCDPGHDDMLAILLAANSPEIHLLGITVVGGNSVIENTASNALRFCTLADLTHLPIAKGMGRGLVRERANITSQIHGDSGLDGYDLPKPKMELQKEHAVDFIIETVLASPQPVTLIPTGPLSNIAMALLLEPKIKENIAEIILMGGAIGLGNRTPAAEFNTWADPEGAKVVFSSGVHVVMIGLEATHKAQMTLDNIARLKALKHPMNRAIAGLLEFAILRYQQFYQTEGFPIHDACAVAVAINRSIATLKHTFVDVVTGESLAEGRTLCDLNNRYGKTPNAEVAVDLQGEKVIEMLFDVMESYESASQ
jgi:inosine-uridine nucleoside N-ribohydrolase